MVGRNIFQLLKDNHPVPDFKRQGHPSFDKEGKVEIKKTFSSSSEEEYPDVSVGGRWCYYIYLYFFFDSTTPCLNRNIAATPKTTITIVLQSRLLIRKNTAMTRQIKLRRYQTNDLAFIILFNYWFNNFLLLPA